MTGTGGHMWPPKAARGHPADRLRKDPETRQLGGGGMVRGVNSKRHLRRPALMRRCLAGFFTGLALILSWASPATAEDSAQGWFDPSRFTIRESINALSTTTTNANGTSSKARAYVSETEFDYRVTDWYQLALVASTSLPGSFGGAGSWNGALLRQTFLMPDAGARPVFVGLAVQFGYMASGAALPALADTNTRFSFGLTPIVGFNHEAWQLILSPTVATGIGANATTALAPAARLTRTISEGFDVGIEYASALGRVGSISQPAQQSHIVYGITDFKLASFDVSLGIGYGLTTASRGLAAKIGVSHGF
jgi:hypothetical protein